MPAFNTLVLLCIIINTVLLALDRHPTPEAESRIFNYFNIFFTFFFTFETGIKLFGLAPSEFVQDKYNIFDAIVVIISIMELAINNG